MNATAVPDATGARTPSIRSRLANALMVWSLAWGLAVGLAVWLAATHEVDELLDDTLQSSAELLALLGAAPGTGEAPAAAVVRPGGAQRVEHFAWQVTAADGALLMRSERAPAEPWHRTPVAGFSDTAQWRIYGLALGGDGRMLYAAQSGAERREAKLDVVLGILLAALAVGLLGHAWLRARVRAEMQPLESLSRHLADWDLDRSGPRTLLGPAERQELEPVHRAIESLTARLSARIANERAFSAHAAHALRTPLAGIDVQLAVALKECPLQMRDRLQRVRGAAARLQSVVAALLGLFRAEGQLRRSEVDVGAMLSRLPAPLLEVHVAPGTRVVADPDLLAAALLNLLDNAQRHGARRAWVEPCGAGGLRVRDDGPGVDAAQRRRLQAALDGQDYENAVGLGLMMADRVARAHAGRLRLPESGEGFAVELDLGPVPAFRATPGAVSAGTPPGSAPGAPCARDSA